MSGVCGAVGLSEDIRLELLREFTDVWATADVEMWSRGFLAAHPNDPGIEQHRGRDTWWVAGDGEAYAVENLIDFVDHSVDSLRDGSVPTVPSGWRANGVLVGEGGGLLHVATEWTGTFPLYYSRRDEGLAFSSLLRPLARTFGSAPDPLGALEFLRHGYCLNGRTPFSGISRFRPGESLTYRASSDRLTAQEHSTLWSTPASVRDSDVDDVLRRIWGRICDALSVAASGEERFGLMMSGGWDSRTLLAALLESQNATRLLGYSHGDTGSREHRIVREISCVSGIECVFAPIQEDVWDPDALQARFEKTETVCFPAWHTAGEMMRELGADLLTAGVYGEVLGGHYGAPSVRYGRDRIRALLSRLRDHHQARLWGSPFEDGERGGVKTAFELLKTETAESHWYLTEDFEAELGDWPAKINEDLRLSLSRLSERGVRGLDGLIEAFRAELRGAQRINAQLLSCRPDVDVAFPFIDRRLLLLVTQLPYVLKINNYLNRRLLRRCEHDLLEFPLAATLVKASRPIWLQELSRGIRRTLEDRGWKRYLEGPAGRRPPRWGWVNFEFLRDGRALRRIRRELSSEIWDYEAIRRIEQDVSTYEYPHRLHPLYDQMSKIYSLDLLYR